MVGTGDKAMKGFLRIIGYAIVIMGCLLAIAICLYSDLVSDLKYKYSLLWGTMLITLTDTWLLSFKKGKKTNLIFAIMETYLFLLFVFSFICK